MLNGMGVGENHYLDLGCKHGQYPDRCVLCLHELPEPEDAVWVRISPRNPLAKKYPTTGWVDRQQWEALRGTSRLFTDVHVHFKTQTVKFYYIVLEEVVTP